MPDHQRRRVTLLGLAIASVLALVASVVIDRSESDGASSPDTTEDDDGGGGDGNGSDGDEPEQAEGEFFRTDYDGLSDPEGYTKPYPNATVEGLLTFRGNLTRSYYGVGPVARTAPRIVGQFPEAPMCRESVNLGETKVWCGMGWTGQPTIVEREDRTWAIFGGYDGHIHFMDAMTGQRILPDVETGDIIKGTPTIDPEGYPLVYSGSRDDLLRVIALDRTGVAEVLWTLDSESQCPCLWNDDWDSSPAIIGDYMIVGSESSRFWVVKLNRSYDEAGLVQVAPEVVFTDQAWDQQVLSDNGGDKHASVESSITVVENVAYFGTSAGLVLGYDLTGLEDGVTPKRAFRFYTAGDNDPTIVADDDGMLYIANTNDRPNHPRVDTKVDQTTSAPGVTQVGQLTKVDPSKPDDPIVWTFTDTTNKDSGIYGTPGVVGDVIVASTNGGRLLGFDRATGQLLWQQPLSGPAWGSPVIVDDVLLIGDCEKGNLHAFDVADPRVQPPVLWEVHLNGCIEATPAVWKGRIYIGSRSPGYLYMLE